MDASNVASNRSAGQHPVVLDAVRSGGSESLADTSNDLSVMFVPAGRGQVTDVQP